MKKTTNNATINNALATMKTNEIKRVLRECASLQDTLATDFDAKYFMCDDEHKIILKELLSQIQDEKHVIELRDTTSCILFVRDEHNNVLFNVYDTFRIQFTTVQAKKYATELLKDERFYTFNYKQKEFISAKSKDINDFIDLCKYCYKAIDASEKASAKTTSATKKAQVKVSNK